MMVAILHAMAVERSSVHNSVAIRTIVSFKAFVAGAFLVILASCARPKSWRREQSDPIRIDMMNGGNVWRL